jgi:nucleoid DNA-binding protein
MTSWLSKVPAIEMRIELRVFRSLSGFLSKEKPMATKAAKPITKSETLQALSAATGLSRKQVATVFDELGKLIHKNLKKGPGVFALAGLVKLKVVHKPARPARKGINPFTKQEQMFKAKPARNVVKALPLKALKEMVK